MNVRELALILEDLPPDADVFIRAENHGYHPLEDAAMGMLPYYMLRNGEWVLVISW